MNRLHRWLSVSQATRKAALLCFGAVLVTASPWPPLRPPAPPAAPYVCNITEGGMSFTSFDGSVDYGQQITAHVGGRSPPSAGALAGWNGLWRATLLRYHLCCRHRGRLRSST